jgi:hypothetical protein
MTHRFARDDAQQRRIMKEISIAQRGKHAVCVAKGLLLSAASESSLFGFDVYVFHARGTCTSCICTATPMTTTILPIRLFPLSLVERTAAYTARRTVKRSHELSPWDFFFASP